MVTTHGTSVVHKKEDRDDDNIGMDMMVVDNIVYWYFGIGIVYWWTILG